MNHKEQTTITSDSIPIHLGFMVRAIRESRGLSYETLAARMGSGVETLKQIESGAKEVDCAQLYMLAKALNVSIDDFFPQFPNASRQEALEAQPEAVPALLQEIPNPEARDELTSLIHLLRHEG